jgi:MFS family permease
MTVSFKHTGFGALRHRNFSLFLLARFCSTLAVQMQGVAVGWQVYSISGNPLDLGLIGLAQFAPFSVLVLVAGQLADRADRRAILFLCFTVECLCGIFLLYFTVTGQQAVWPVFAVMALYGSARAFMMPTAQALMPNLVPAEHFANAVALNSSSLQVAILTGPTLGGLLYVFGPERVYFSVACLLLASQILLLFVSADRRAASNQPASWRTFLEGLQFVWGKPVVLGAISLDLFAVLFGGATALLPAVASDILHVGPVELGLLRTAPGLGAALTALTLAFFPISRRVGRWMFDGVVLFGFATIAFGLSDNLYVSLAALALLGSGDMVSMYIRQMLVQLETPDAIRGRVSAVNAVFIGASNELGEFESGLAAAWLGLAPSIIAGGFATLAVALIWVRGFPALRRMDRFPRPMR